MLLDGPILFFRGRDEILLPLPVYKRIPANNGALGVGNIFPSLIPAEDHYDKMVTWEEVLSGQGIPDPEIGFHTVFGEVDPTWYMEWYKQPRRKHQVHRQIELLIYDMPDRTTLHDE